MSIEKCKDFEKDGYGTWDDSSNPTTFARWYDVLKENPNIKDIDTLYKNYGGVLC